MVCQNGSGKPRKIRIGNIQNISVIMRSEEVTKEITVDFEDFEHDAELDPP
jgi:hypothetical protein